MRTASLSHDQLLDVIRLERLSGARIVAVSHASEFATLSEGELARVRDLECDLNVTLLAYGGGDFSFDWQLPTVPFAELSAEHMEVLNAIETTTGAVLLAYRT